METQKEPKVDKRTKAYKDSVKAQAIDGLSHTPEAKGKLTTLAENNPGCHKCGKQEDLVVISPQISICRSCLSGLQQEPEPNKPNNPVCMHCGDLLPPNEDGTKKYYRVPTPCKSCVDKNYTRGIINGKEFDINPTDPPKLHIDDNGTKVYKDSKGKVYG